MRTFRVTQSEIATFTRCRRKWYLSQYRELRPVTVELVGARATGVRVHEALEAFYVPARLGPVDPRTRLEEVIERDTQALVRAYEDDPVRLSDKVRELEDAARLERIMVTGYVEWLEETGADADLVITDSEVELEVPFEVPGLENEVTIMGKLDIRAHRTTDDKRIFLDTKTTGSIAELRKVVRQSQQMLHYLLIERSLPDQDHHVAGAMYNALRKVKRTAAAKPPFYERIEVWHNEHELASYRRRLAGIIRDMAHVYSLLDDGYDHIDIAYPTPNGDCSWSCDYFEVCPLFDDGSRVEDMLTNNFTQKNPLDRYRTVTDERTA